MLFQAGALVDIEPVYFKNLRLSEGLNKALPSLIWNWNAHSPKSLFWILRLLTLQAINGLLCCWQMVSRKKLTPSFSHKLSIKDIYDFCLRVYSSVLTMAGSRWAVILYTVVTLKSWQLMLPGIKNVQNIMISLCLCWCWTGRMECFILFNTIKLLLQSSC